MSWAKIQSYYAEWDMSSGKGRIGLKDDDDEWHWSYIDDEDEFLNVTNILKNEDIIFIDTRIGYLGQIIKSKPRKAAVNIPIYEI